ncbi:hypothetical protein [Neoroseomonas eburnea]|uniref:hypothetical protein n=1 Tax=Neoroseomonas eburnea TaxID=1346889 RepID=UPI001BA7DEBA|nr:hypothetical protein [Neoroseomonas eburnea]
MRIVTLLVLMTLLPNCAGTGSAGCEAWRPILIGAEDQLTTETARAILAHNLTGRRLCGW